MRVLFLDDNEERWNKALENFEELLPKSYAISEMKWAQTAQECIQMLQDEQWDAVSLDHDLGGEVHVDSNREDTGMEVVRWIIANRAEIPFIIVHSWNIPAARRMCEQLRMHYYQVLMKPFGF